MGGCTAAQSSTQLCGWGGWRWQGGGVGLVMRAHKEFVPCAGTALAGWGGVCNSRAGRDGRLQREGFPQTPC